MSKNSISSWHRILKAIAPKQKRESAPTPQPYGGVFGPSVPALESMHRSAGAIEARYFEQATTLYGKNDSARDALLGLVNRIEQCGSYRELMASDEFKEARRVLGV